MTLQPIEGYPRHFRDTASGKVFNLQEFREFEHTTAFTGVITGDICPRGEDWVLMSWAVLLHPWPEVIPTSIIVELVIDAIPVADAPLFAVAEPMARSEDQDLRDRVEAIEKKLEMGYTIRPVKRVKKLLYHKHILRARVREGYDDLEKMPIFEVFSLLLRGVKRVHTL